MENKERGCKRIKEAEIGSNILERLDLTGIGWNRLSGTLPR